MRKLICVFVLLLIVFIIEKSISLNKINYIKENYYKDKMDIYLITIEKINIKNIIKEDTIKSEKIKDIVLFKEYGKPNIKNSNTIIGAHSGNGRNSFFTNLNNIEIDDEIKLYYKEIEYIYKVIDKFYIIESDFKILNNIKNKTTLTLFTCNEDNNKYRLIVVSELIDFI
ncbi:MAG: sortase [Bacilli bacterium]|nr:sortase [Bacilli bacterium]MDD4624177.1 sortase [Bacilli bacterium]MDD4831880.1 sortase [Bacilli bacterium]